MVRIFHLTLSSSEENILFIMDVLTFTKIQEVKEQKEFANIIYHNFIRISSEKELNMSLQGCYFDLIGP